MEKNVTRGVVTQEEMNSFLASLPDDGENLDWVDMQALESEKKPSKSLRSAANAASFSAESRSVLLDEED
jgi:hypothetical protein